MQRITSCTFDSVSLMGEIEAIKFTPDGSGAMMAFPPSGGLPALPPAIGRVVAEIAAIRGQRPLHLMINKLAPGVSVPVHRDFLKATKHQAKYPTVERWHLPVQTGFGVDFWHEGGSIEHFEAGVWVGPIPYWLRHSVRNAGQIERVHIVVDLDSPEPVGKYAEDV